MKDRSRARISARRAVLVAMIASAVLVIAAFASSAYMRKGVSATNTEFTPAQQGQKPERVETELITLQQTGFEPNEIRRPQGAFILGVDNRSGLEAIELRLVRGDGQRLTVLAAHRRKISWREVVDLPPGQYLLSEVNHSDWICNIAILPR